MLVTKCDSCKKLIKDDKSIIAGIGFSRVELCEKCGAPISKFLEKNKLIELKTYARRKSQTI